MANSKPSVLFVCLGNICRSPLGEGVFRSIVKKNNLDLVIDSCGTGDWHIGQQPDHRSIKVAKLHNVDISNLRARLIEVTDFYKFDYIVCMDDSNYNNVINMKPKDSKSNIIKFMSLLPENKNKIVPDV